MMSEQIIIEENKRLRSFLEKLRDDPEAKPVEEMSIVMALNDKDVKLAVRLAVQDTKYRIAQEAAEVLLDSPSEG